jgi:cell division protein FtsN
MAQRRKRRSSRTKSRSKNKQEYPGWAWGVWGLAIGLSVAAAVWVSDRRDAPVEPAVARYPASLEPVLDQNGEQDDTTETEAKKDRFEFYEMLKEIEVIIADEDPEVAVDVEPRAIEEPGTYVLQAGSFSAYADADRRRAELALQGIESDIQKVTIDDRTYHRVRIGPTRDLDKLNMIRSRLREARIDVLRIRLGD